MPNTHYPLPVTQYLLTTTLLLTTATLFAQQTQPTTTPAAAANPYQHVPQPANPPRPAPHPRDALPLTSDSIPNLNPNLPTLFIAGDSTAANGTPTTRGWGAVLIDYFDTTKINLCNRALGGARFNTYTASWQGIVNALKPGDTVIIQFGHNSGPLPGIGDETQEAPARAGTTTTIRTHGAYLRQFIKDTRSKNATPIALTLTPRDLWKDGKVERLKELTVGTGTGMSDWTRQIAKLENATLLDHNQIIADQYDKLGMTETDKLFGDHYLHTNTAGAIVNAEAFITGLKSLNSPLVQFLNEKGKSIPAKQNP